MGRGQWTRWGRGTCEGWSLEIGVAFRGSVVRRDITREQTTWIASINSTDLGEFLEREIAMRRVEELVESSMRLPVILAENDWPKWLGEEPASEQDLLALLKPCPDEALKIWPVDKMVGNIRNNGPQLVMPILIEEKVFA
jgi:SOS response associated peptidase (SRAP)